MCSITILWCVCPFKNVMLWCKLVKKKDRTDRDKLVSLRVWVIPVSRRAGCYYSYLSYDHPTVFRSHSTGASIRLLFSWLSLSVLYSFSLAYLFCFVKGLFVFFFDPLSFFPHSFSLTNVLGFVKGSFVLFFLLFPFPFPHSFTITSIHFLWEGSVTLS